MQRMSYVEYLDWVRYRNQWGPLHTPMRIDRAIARACAHWFGGRITDFSPHDKQNTSVDDEIDSVLRQLG